MSALQAELARHVGHRLSTSDGTRLRCHDCAQTVSLAAVLASTSSTSNPPISTDPPRDQQCPEHVGEWEHACRCCRAEALERGTERSRHAPVHLPVEKNPPPAGLLDQARAAVTRPAQETR